MTGLKNVDISHAILRSTSVANVSDSFTTLAWSYSTDGTNWTSIENYDISTLYSTTLTYAGKAITIPSNSTFITALDNASTAYLKMTVSGATAANTSIRLDNIKVKATSISAINDVQNQSKSVVYSNSNGQLIIKCDDNAPYEIISANGQMIAKGIALAGENNISVATKGLLLVKVNGHVTKIIQ
jgi:hypothetical protein